MNLVELSEVELRYDLAYQEANVVSTWGNGKCGHAARGCRICADCLRAELTKREQAGGGSS